MDEPELIMAIFMINCANDSSIMGANIRVFASLTITAELDGVTFYGAFDYPQ